MIYSQVKVRIEAATKEILLLAAKTMHITTQRVYAVRNGFVLSGTRRVEVK